MRSEGLGSELTDLLGNHRCAKRGVGFASIWWICVVFCRRHQLLPRRGIVQRILMGSQATVPAGGGGFGHVWHAGHAAALFGSGGALGYCAGAIVLMMTSCPPQRGQGRARTRGGSSVSPGPLSSARPWSDMFAPSSRLILAILAARLPFAKKP